MPRPTSLEEWINVVEDERDDLKLRLADALQAGRGALAELEEVARTLELERAAHQVTAERLEEERRLKVEARQIAQRWIARAEEEREE